MKKPISTNTKQTNNKKKITNPKNSSRHSNLNNTFQGINSSLSSITSSSISIKSKDSNRIFSPSNKVQQNQKTKNLINYKSKTIQMFSPNKYNINNSIIENSKHLKKSFLSKEFDSMSERPEKSKKLKINNDNNIGNTSLKTPKDKNNINQKKISNTKKDKNKNNDIPGLLELDKDLMQTYNINKNDRILNEEISLNEAMFDRSNEFNYFKLDNEEKLTPFQKQEKTIKKLLRTKNYQKFVRNLLKNEPIIVNQDGKKIEFSLYNKDLYNYEFLDIYFKHNIPYIILRPRLDILKRRREEKLKKLKEEENKEKEREKEENKEIKDENIEEKLLISKNSHSQGNESQLASLFDKSLSIINHNDSSIIKLDKKEPLLQIQEIQFPGTFVLTKIPEKTEENTQNRRLNIAFNKAKDAARVVRRLEYSYGMRINFLLTKPIFQQNAKIIQTWWRDMSFAKNNKNEIIKLQAYIRGAMIRKAFKDVKHTYFYKIPFLRDVDKVITRRKLKIFFDKIVAKYAILKLLNQTKPYIDKIENALKKFKNRRQFLRENHLLYYPKKNKCCYTKEIFDWEEKLKLYKAQAAVKFYLMHNNERVIKEKYTNKYNPKLFYMLKYGNNKEKMKKKLKNFRQTFLKFKELKLKATLPGKIDNKFELFKYILRKKIFNNLLKYYLDSLNNKNQKYQEKTKMKLLLNHLQNKRNKDKLKNYFTKWNMKANYLKGYYGQLQQKQYDKLYILEAIFRYQKKYREKAFLLLLQIIQKEKKETQNKAADKIYDLYNRRNGFEYENNLIHRILQIWKKKAYQLKIDKAANTINLKAKKFLDNLHKKKLNAILNCYNIRNKIFKEKLKLWKFNAHKINHHFNFFKNKTLAIIKTKQKLNCLKKNFNSLLNRKKEQLRKYFNRFKTNTGIRKLVLINIQLCFFNENKEIISRDKYSMLKFLRNSNNIDIDKIKRDIVLKKTFTFWKIEKKAAGLKRLCGKRISDLSTRAFYLEKLKFLHWYKIAEHLKYDKASRLIQKNYRLYLDKNGKKNKNLHNNDVNNKDLNNNKHNNKDLNNIEENKKDNNNIDIDLNNKNINNNEENKEENGENEKKLKKKKRWKRYDRTIKEEDEK